MPPLYLELALILIPGHVGCDRRLEQTLLERLQPRMPTRPLVALTGSDSGTCQTGHRLSPSNLDAVSFFELPTCSGSNLQEVA